MRVKMLKDKSVPIDSLTIKNWPAGWTGDVEDEIVEAWKPGEDYEARAVEVPAEDKRKEFLDAFADQALKIAEANAAAVNDAEPETAEDLRALTVPQLRQRAKEAGIKGTSRMTEDQLIAALLG